MNLEYILPANLGEVWTLVSPGLDKVREHSGDVWLNEDVYMALKQGHSTLHVGYQDGRYVGFMILTPSSSFDGNVLHIWATYSEGRNFCVFTEGMETIKDYAKNLNAKRITFMSPRKGWERHGEKLGFKPRTTQYAMEV
jgi:hypothetical protein